MSAVAETAYIVFDAESVVDGPLVSRVLYPGEDLEPEAAVQKQREERLEASGATSDFIPVSFHVPVSVCVARVGKDFRLLDLADLDAPRYDPRQIVELFWKGVQMYRKAILVDFNGRGFDLPLLSLAAFRFGVSCPAYFDDDRYGHRYRFTEKHIDLMEWLTEYGAYRLKGGLDLCAKLLGKPGKQDTTGAQVDEMYREGQLREINDYCLHDVLDTYFVFLRTRVLAGQVTLEEEQRIVGDMKDWIAERAETRSSLRKYLEAFGDWDPRPFV